LFSLCENSNPNAWMAEKMSGHSPDSFGYSYMTGGYAGGQAEYARVPLLMSVPFKIPDEKALFLRNPPTGYKGCRKLQSPSRPHCGGRLSS
jgi:threonine dehydrogenase-like Zn-dependent dehydrogenase